MRYRAKYDLEWINGTVPVGAILAEPTDDDQARRLWELLRGRAIEEVADTETPIAEMTEPEPESQTPPPESVTKDGGPILGRRRRPR